MKIGFTGTREGMTYEQKRTLASLLSYYRAHNNAEEFHHGNCIGSDDEAAIIADQISYVTVAHPSNLVEYTGNYVSDIICPRRPPLKRNHDIVKACDMMIATPKEYFEPTVKRGQGTWSAIRFSRDKCKKHTIIIWPDGSCIA